MMIKVKRKIKNNFKDSKLEPNHIQTGKIKIKNNFYKNKNLIITVKIMKKIKVNLKWKVTVITVRRIRIQSIDKTMDLMMMAVRNLCLKMNLKIILKVLKWLLGIN